MGADTQDRIPREARRFTIYVCGNCGSDNIECSTMNDSLCGDCGEWMNTEAVVVARPEAVCQELATALRERATHTKSEKLALVRAVQEGDAAWIERFGASPGGE